VSSVSNRQGRGGYSRRGGGTCGRCPRAADPLRRARYRPGVSAHFISPDFLRLTCANSPGLLHRVQSSVSRYPNFRSRPRAVINSPSLPRQDTANCGHWRSVASRLQRTHKRTLELRTYRAQGLYFLSLVEDLNGMSPSGPMVVRPRFLPQRKTTVLPASTLRTSPGSISPLRVNPRSTPRAPAR